MAPPAPPDSPASNAALLAARDGAVVCDLSPLAVLAITGPDAADFLHGQLSTDVRGMPEGACRHTSFNSPKGRMLANFVLWRDSGGDGFRALLPGDIAGAIAKRLQMYVLRSKVTIGEVSASVHRCGVGGPEAAHAVKSAWGVVPGPFETAATVEATILGLPGPRFVVLAAARAADAVRTALARHATAAPYDVWQWLTIRAGVPVVTAATQDAFVAQMANWELLGGVDFAKGCYTGQEIVARTQHLGRLKERTFLFHLDAASAAPGDRIYGAVFGDQPCGTVVNAAAAPGGGSDLLVVMQIAAAEQGGVRLGAPDGPVLSSQPLPYAIPAPTPPRGRIA